MHPRWFRPSHTRWRARLRAQPPRAAIVLCEASACFSPLPRCPGMQPPPGQAQAGRTPFVPGRRRPRGGGGTFTLSRECTLTQPFMNRRVVVVSARSPASCPSRLRDRERQAGGAGRGGERRVGEGSAGGTFLLLLLRAVEPKVYGQRALSLSIATLFELLLPLLLLFPALLLLLLLYSLPQKCRWLAAEK